MRGLSITSVALLAAVTVGCLPIGPPEPQGSYLFLAQIGGFFTREQILQDEEALAGFAKLGIPLEAVGDKTAAIARSACCGGPDEWSIGAFVPADIDAKVGDVVAIKHAREKQGRHVMMNVVVGVRASPGPSGDLTGTACRWVPANPRLWLRNLFCDGLREEGWAEFGKGVRHEWRKILLE